MPDVLAMFFTELNDFAAWAWQGLGWKLTSVPWGDWRGFWLRFVIDGPDPRFLLFFFLPLVPVFWLFPRRHIRLGVVLTSFVFIAYVFGVAFLLFWVALCGVFYLLSERYAVDLQRRDKLRWNPSVVVVVCITLWYLISLDPNRFTLYTSVNDWLYNHAPWLFPLGARPFSWEAFHVRYVKAMDEPLTANLIAQQTAQMAASPPRLIVAMAVSPQTCGLVILTIRMIHYFSEIKRGTIPRERRTFFNFLAFNSFAPVLAQGPIERFKDFDEGIDRCHDRRTARDMLYGLYRIGEGLLKNLVCLIFLAVPMVESAKQLYWAPQAIKSYAVLFFSVHFQVIVLYLYFSGYCDAAVGMARLVGYRATENFDRPWLSRSLTDLWRRWHISFSFILRDYIFMPLVRRRWGLISALVVTFGICGILHNCHVPYVIWGVLMGLMVGINQKWTRWLRELDRHPQRRLARVRKAWMRLWPLPSICAWLLTMNSFAITGIIAFGGVNSLRVFWELIRRPIEALLPG